MNGPYCGVTTRRQRKRHAAANLKKSMERMNFCEGNEKKMVRIVEDSEDGRRVEDVDTLLAPLELEESEDELNELTEEVEIRVANDSGSVDHVVHPKDIPKTVQIVKPKRVRNFVSVSGDGIKNYGTADVELEMGAGNVVNGTFSVADVTRPLHSTSKICDEEKEVLFTKGEATVVPAGSLSKFLGMCRQIATYEREGGLYLAKMKVRVRRPRAKDAESPAKTSGFGGPGSSR